MKKIAFILLLLTAALKGFAQTKILYLTLEVKPAGCCDDLKSKIDGVFVDKKYESKSFNTMKLYPQQHSEARKSKSYEVRGFLEFIEGRYNLRFDVMNINTGQYVTLQYLRFSDSRSSPHRFMGFVEDFKKDLEYLNTNKETPKYIVLKTPELFLQNRANEAPMKMLLDRVHTLLQEHEFFKNDFRFLVKSGNSPNTFLAQVFDAEIRSFLSVQDRAPLLARAPVAQDLSNYDKIPEQLIDSLCKQWYVQRH